MAVCTLNVVSEDVADFIDRYGNETDTELYERLQTDCIDFVSNEYVITYYPLAQVSPISITRNGYSRTPNLYGLLDTTAPAAAGVTAVLDNPNLNADGSGVILGFIDTGIDYQNPLFRYSDGSSRIIGIWDQTIQRTSRADNPYSLYGTTYTQARINEALASADPLSLVPTLDTNGHGTFMAGVAAGNIMPDGSFVGCAPNAMIAAVKLKPAKAYLRNYYLIEPEVPAFQENDIMMGVRYLVQLANEYRAPVVIYLGVGTNQGNHTGVSPLGLQIQDLALPYGVTFVTAAGNETGLHHHFRGNLQPDDEFEDVEIRVAPGYQGFCMELWGNAPELYTVGFVSPSGQVIERLPDISLTESIITFPLDNSTVSISFIHVENASGDSLIFIRFQNPSPGIWHLRVYPSVFFTGNYHIWLPMDNFIPADTIFLRPNPDTIITEPGNSIFALTIGAYDHVTNQIYIHSSRGFNRNEDITPGITAPGVNVSGPLPTVSAATPDTGQPMPDESDSPPVNMPEVRYTRKTGTSVAAAIYAGAAADFLSWNLANGNSLPPSSASIRAFFIRGARRNPALSYPSREWGYGIMDLYESFQHL